MTPARPRSLTTGRWRMRFPVIMAAQSSTGVSGPQAVTGVVMTSATLVAAGSRRCATTRRRMSRSVKMPTSRPPSVTTSPPMPRSLISSAAFSTVSPGFTEMTSLPFRARMSWTVGILDTTALRAGAPPYPVSATDIVEGALHRRCHYGAGSYQRRPARCARPPGRRHARDRRRADGARRLLPGTRVSHLDRVRGDDVRRYSVRDGRVQGRDGGVRLPVADPLGARRLAPDRAQRVLGPVGGDLRGGRRVQVGADTPVPVLWAGGGEYGSLRALSRERHTSASHTAASDAAHGMRGIVCIGPSPPSEVSHDEPRRLSLRRTADRRRDGAGADHPDPDGPTRSGRPIRDLSVLRARHGRGVDRRAGHAARPVREPREGSEAPGRPPLQQ